MLVVWDGAGLGRALEESEWWGGSCGRGGCEGDVDEGGFALGGREGEQASAQGGAEGPGGGGGEGVEFVRIGLFLGDED